MGGRQTRLLVITIGLLVSSCSRSNNLLLGRVEAMVGEHKVEVTDCYRINAPQPYRLSDSWDGKQTYVYGPCRDAFVIIRGDQLTVNGKGYGALKPGDVVTVDHGRVLVNKKAVAVVGDK